MGTGVKHRMGTSKAELLKVWSEDHPWVRVGSAFRRSLWANGKQCLNFHVLHTCKECLVATQK